MLLEQTGRMAGSYFVMCVVEAGKTYQVLWLYADAEEGNILLYYCHTFLRGNSLILNC
jgi:hypothetical protein